MRILNLNEELQEEDFPARSVEQFLRVNTTDAHWLVNDVFHRKHLPKTQMKTVLVALHECTSTKETFDVISSLFVQYFTCGNYGFVKLVNLNDPVWKDYAYLMQLLKKAVCFLNENAEKSGFQRCNDIFSFVSKRTMMSTKHTWFQHCKFLYSAGFRLIETKDTLCDISSDFCLLVYKPCLVPNYQVEDGVVGDQIETSVVLNFCEHLITTMNASNARKQEVREIQECMKMLENCSKLMLNAIRPSFPWNGKAGPCSESQVAVVGGGLAGLAAAASLSEAGFDVVLLEAANYLGGRVKQVQPFKGFGPFDLGGEFIHGSNTVVNKIAFDNGWQVLPAAQCKDDGEGEKISYKGELYSTMSDQPEIKAAREIWNEIISSTSKSQECESVSLSDSLLVRLQDKGLSQDILDVIEYWKLRISAGSLKHYGVREGRRRMESKHEWGLKDYRLAESYSQLVKYYLDHIVGVDKRLNWQVKNVVWNDDDRMKSKSGGRILLTNQLGDMLTAKYVIITVPLTILKDGDITFVPSLPANKTEAIDTIQMFAAWKIVCRFKHCFWPKKLHQLYCVRGFVSEMWMWSRDSLNGDDKCHVVVGFETADSAEQKSGLRGGEVLEGFLSHLDEMFGTPTDLRPATDSFVDYTYFHWSNHPFIRGGYTSPTVHAYDLRHVLGSPVSDRLFFAGEATSLRSCSTVPTAIETGVRAANQVCNAAGVRLCAKL